jgi:AAA+ ATPase superfamily predicted ATPase
MASAGTTPFYGREHELQRLQELTGKKTASLVIIKGRRRIGKSRLATELARRLPSYSALSFQGLPPTARLTAEYFASVIDFGELMASADIST